MRTEWMTSFLRLRISVPIHLNGIDNMGKEGLFQKGKNRQRVSSDP